MQIAVRSYLTAGTVAVVGAGAIALTPVITPATSALHVPAPAVAEVALTGLSLSLTEVLGLLQGFGIGGGLPEVFTALPSLLPNDIVTAVVDEFLAQASPLVLGAAGEVFTYLGAAIAGLITGPASIPVRFADDLAAIPVALVSAVQTLGAGDLATALQTVSDALAGPSAGISAVLTEAGAAFQDFLTTEFNGLVGALPGVLFAAVQTVFTNNVQSLLDTISGALSGLLGGFLPGAAAVSLPVVRGAAGLPAAAALPAAGASEVSAVVVADPAADPAPVADRSEPAGSAVAAVGKPDSAAVASGRATRAVVPPRAPSAAQSVTDVATDADNADAQRPASDSRATAGRAGAARGAHSATR